MSWQGGRSIQVPYFSSKTTQHKQNTLAIQVKAKVLLDSENLIVAPVYFKRAVASRNIQFPGISTTPNNLYHVLIKNRGNGYWNETIKIRKSKKLLLLTNTICSLLLKDTHSKKLAPLSCLSTSQPLSPWSRHLSDTATIMFVYTGNKGASGWNLSLSETSLNIQLYFCDSSR